jgi:hypothetical protein
MHRKQEKKEHCEECGAWFIVHNATNNASQLTKQVRMIKYKYASSLTPSKSSSEQVVMTTTAQNKSIENWTKHTSSDAVDMQRTKQPCVMLFTVTVP